MDYTKLSDEDLAKNAKCGNQECWAILYEKYKKLIMSLVRTYYLSGADNEDLMQEGYFGFISAINTFDGKSKLRNYICLCVKNAVFSAIKKYSNNKNTPLNSYVSLSGYSEDDSLDKTMIIVSSTNNPEDGLIKRESENELNERIKEVLSGLEYKIFALYLQGFSYVEIAEKLKKSEKSIDNALHRSRKKICDVLKK